ncbi:MAG TPA: tripartite tricarboxylate transporter substrate binding protein [Usitatibacter sp.]|nr:tripartite tricarboxylate transporter substrate binding protein [Usitatibacter sp.]
MDLRHLQRFVLSAAVSFLATLPGTAFGGGYPSRPVTLVVPYGPGGNGDLSARALAEAIGHDKLLDEPVVVENRDGAGGMIGTQYVKNAQKDGYTLLLARIGSQVVAPALDPSTPYKWDDLTPIGLLEIDPYVCVVKANSPYRTFKDLIAAIKANPGTMSFATSSNMDASVVFPVKAFLDEGLPASAAIKVPYKGGGATVAPVLGGTVDFTCNGIAPYFGAIKAGTLRALIVSTPSRLPDLPDVPTAAELGLKDLEMVSGWNALYGPPGLAADVVKRWEAILDEAKRSPYWLSLARKRGTVPSVLSAAKTHEFVREQYEAYHGLSNYIGPNK